MDEKPICTNCSVPLEAGYIPQFSSSYPAVQRWFSHLMPINELTRWKNRKKWREAHVVSAYRCPLCGTLELFANPPFYDEGNSKQHK